MESVRSWVRQADINDGVKTGVASDATAAIQRLEQELRKMKRANDILKRAASFFGAELDRQQMMESSLQTRIRTMSLRGEGLVLGSSAGCCRWRQVLIYTARVRAPSGRTLSDADPSRELYSLGEANQKVYGVRNLWKAARCAGIDVGRDQTARLMRSLGVEGVKRVFSSTAPNQLWVTDLTFAPTWTGVAYVCFLVDVYSRTIVGWQVASHMKTKTVLDAIEMARWSRGKHLPGLRWHSDAGSQFTSIRYGERLAEIDAVPCIGTIGDSFDNGLAQTVSGYYKSELVRGPEHPGPRRMVEELKLATLG